MSGGNRRDPPWRGRRGWQVKLLVLALAVAGCGGSKGAVRAGSATHRVREGETLYAIARRYDTDVDTLVRLNRLDDPDRLEVGQVLRLPRETPPAPPPEPPAAPRMERAPDPVLACDAHDSAPRSRPSASGFAWPVDGVILTRFGQWDGQKHEGLAIGAPLGTPVWASAAGRVVLVGKEPGFGQVVVIRHAEGWVSLYGSLERACIEPDRWVQRGALLGLVGVSSGVASPRLYFELRGPDGPVDPRPRLP